MTTLEMMTNRVLAGKTLLVTGAAKRLGRAIALAAAENGADVAITYRNSAREARAVIEELALHGVEAVAVRCDVTDERSVREMVKEVAGELGGIDVLVNNAANYETAEFDKITVAQWDAIFASNTRGPFLVSREALPYLKTPRPYREYGFAGRTAALGDACALLFVKGRAAHADESDGEGAGSGNRRQCGGSGDD